MLKGVICMTMNSLKHSTRLESLDAENKANSHLGPLVVFLR